jgi:hypothetical protein
MATSDLALGMSPDAVLALGDLQYEMGELTNFDASYAPSWGRLRAITHPAPGNHEYYTASAAGYYNYFRVDHTPGGSDDETGGTVDPYYAFDLGSWRVIALNSNCTSVGGCGPGSPEETWLRAELADHPAQCTLAYWHHPRFSSGAHGNDTDVDGFWQALVAGGADLVLNGHDHDYERFAPMNAFGVAQPLGTREIVAGLGGKNTIGFGTDPLQPASQKQWKATFGVLGLTLRPGGYDWRMMPIGGSTAPIDSGSAACR